ncbi:uncharacterized protein LOC127100820 [Lathyrus oleraceus]|uniref:uncharacterized protein LOC127100820 n=1 Tax=Pisum sativum TaxID=3888 RepID=UPI0021D1C434|nr:uncharacterized protein LOC127100820 [Pisum sativum]XP_050894061.1 uncharacterized protein LOC127100820 [Pisum sativum]
MFTLLSEDDEVVRTEERDRKVDALAEKIRAMECQNSLGFDVTDMGLVDGLRIPYKFKAPSFDKYNDTSCPRTHVQAYYRKISAYADDEKMWIYFFQDSLSGASLDWYMDLKRESIRSWRDWGEAFLRQYKHNMDMAPSRTQLQSLCQKTGESFKEYAQRWRELAARVQPPMLERELTDMFIGTLQGVFMDRMGSCPFSSFSGVVVCGERTESLIKAGKIQDPCSSSSSSSKKPSSGAPRRGESETNAVHRQRNMNRRQYRQVAAVTIPATQQYQRRPTQQYQHQQHRPQQQAYQPHNGNQASTSNERKKITFDPIPMSYAELYPSLIERNLITPRDPPAIPVNPRWWYKPDQHCVYHSGAPGHDVDSCFQLKIRVQDLMRLGILSFEDLGPNVNRA